MKIFSLLKLYMIFVKIGAILLGGGYVILPIVQNEFAYKRNLVSKEVLVDYFALSQSLPGIIAANISMFIGYKLKGVSGAIAAMLGVITVPFLCILLLASIFGKLMGNPFITGIFWGVGIAVIALVMLAVREIWQNSQRNGFFYLIFLSSLIALLVFDLPPVQTILIFTAVGILLKLGGKR